MIIYFSMLETDSDRDVFQKLYEENRQKLYYIAWNILHHEADAEDAVHTCFFKMAEHFAKYRHLSYEDLVKLFSVAVKNAARDIARGYAKQGDFFGEGNSGEEYIPDIGPDLLEQVIERYENNLIKQALMQLTEDEREFLNLQYGLELKPKDIATLMGMTPQAVRKKMLRCRNKVAKVLEGREYESLR